MGKEHSTFMKTEWSQCGAGCCEWLDRFNGGGPVYGKGGAALRLPRVGLVSPGVCGSVGAGKYSGDWDALQELSLAADD
jgi:hypothetical protein